MPPVAHPGCDCVRRHSSEACAPRVGENAGKFQFGNPEVEAHPPSAM